MDNQVAITVKGYGSGLVYYVGAYLDNEAQEALFERFLRTAMIKPLMITPQGVEVCKRVNLVGEQYLILINHNPIELKVPFPWAAHERLTDQHVEGELTLAPYGVAVLMQAEAQQPGENINNE